MNGYGWVHKERIKSLMVDLYIYILAVFILIAFYLDVRYHKIPNWLSMGGILIGFIYHGISDGLSGIVFSLLGVCAGGGIMLFLYLFKGVAAGDVKLFAAIGAITGVQFTLYGLMYSVLLAGLIGVIIIIFRKDLIMRVYYGIIRFFSAIFKKDMKDLEQYKKQEAVRFPFMYAVLPGMIITTFYYFQ